MLHSVCIIADMLVKLHVEGCVRYIGWQCSYEFGKSTISDMENIQKCMSHDLYLWRDAVDAARNECYALNSYTTKQLLLLRSQLLPFFVAGSLNFDLTPNTFSLLKYLCPYADKDTTLNVLKESWKCMEANIILEESITVISDNFEAPDVIDETPCPTANLIDVIVNEILNDKQRLLFIELTEIQGLTERLWVITEILKRGEKANSTEILMHVMECCDDGDKPNQEVLLKYIEDNLEIKQVCFKLVSF